MPAKKEYLSSPKQRFLKVSAAILGAYFVSASLHLMLAVIIKQKEIVMLTSTFTLFLVWGALMVITFLARSGVKIWGLYILLTMVFLSITYLFK
ncbi:MAG: hypothetical protein U5M51_00990 [Emticicia sp.]|nr:hypothetical protein [Emticicia sp.]